MNGPSMDGRQDNRRQGHTHRFIPVRSSYVDSGEVIPCMIFVCNCGEVKDE
jgi:hypothetical protein